MPQPVESVGFFEEVPNVERHVSGAYAFKAIYRASPELSITLTATGLYLGHLNGQRVFVPWHNVAWMINGPEQQVKEITAGNSQPAAAKESPRPANSPVRSAAKLRSRP
jgi:hypothetical protein